MMHKSIRWRIQAWHTLLLVFLVAGMLGAFYGYERGERIRAMDTRLQSLLTPLLPSLRPPHRRDFEGEPPPPEREPHTLVEFEKGSFYYAAWSPDHELMGKSAAAPAVAMPGRAADPKRPVFRNRDGARELVYFGPQGDAVVIGTSLAPMNAELNQLALKLTGLGLALTLFGMAGGWWVAGQALRPIAQISATAQQIAGGNRGERIDIRETQSELGQLAEVLNRTFDQQDKAFEQQVRFTADASHELRTPVSVILTQVQLALSRDRDGQEYRDTLQICQRAAERMRALVNSLLELARVDSGEFKLTLENCDLSHLASDSLSLIAPLAREKGATLRSAVQPVRIKVDSARIGQVLVNLLCNAMQHNSREVEVCLAVECTADEAVLRVTDNGVGISEEALPHVFERFYRADKSRTGTKNGSGLGLAISQAIVHAHGGKICAANQSPHGAIFTVSLPLAG